MIIFSKYQNIFISKVLEFQITFFIQLQDLKNIFNFFFFFFFFFFFLTNKISETIDF